MANQMAIERVTRATVDDVAGALRRLVSSGGSWNRLCIQQGPAWFVVIGSRSQAALECVAAARKDLPDDAGVSLEDVLKLRRAGFSKSGRRAGLTRAFLLDEADDAEVVAALLVSLMGDVYGQPEDASLSVEIYLGDQEPTENPRLLEAMRAAAKSRGPDVRQRLYRAMLRGTFLVPMSGDAPKVAGDLSGWDSYAAFTDAEHLQLWSARPTDYRIIKGRALFPLLMSLRTGSLLINPGGLVGGELYRNEVEAIASAVQ